MKADYSKIAAYYDTGRSLSTQNTDMWMGLISELSRAKSGASVLDLGCGTGSFSLPMATTLGFDVTGADASAEMLEKAKRKDPDSLVAWVQEDAGALSFPNDTFDIVFMSHLLHHVDSPLTALEECYRVLAPSGVILIRYGAMDQIIDDVEHTFFYGVIDIDRERTPTATEIETWLTEVGFEDILSQEIVQRTYRDAGDHLHGARSKSTSALSMISEESLQTGIRRLEEYIQKHPKDPWLLHDRMTITAGHHNPFFTPLPPHVAVLLKGYRPLAGYTQEIRLYLARSARTELVELLEADHQFIREAWLGVID